MVQRAHAIEDRSLTEQVVQYQKTGAGLPALLERIAPLVYGFPGRTRGATEDDCGDFYCYFFPRIPSLLGRFRFRGTDFEAYLNTCMRWQYKTFVRKKQHDLIAHAAARRDTFWAPESADVEHVAESSAPSEVAPRVRFLLRIDGRGVIEDPIVARRVLLLFLKASQEAGETTVRRIAQLTGTSTDWLVGKTAELHEKLEHRRERRAAMRKRRDQAFFRLHFFETRLRIETDRDQRIRLARLINLERVHLENARRALSRVPVCPTHRDIADVLGIPKGSVDSGLYYLRRTLHAAGEIESTHGMN